MGFSPTAPGILYLMTNSEWQAAKIGCTTTAAHQDRIATHQATGWALAKKWDLPTGADAYEIEQTIIKVWRDAGHPDVVPPEEMPQRGAEPECVTYGPRRLSTYLKPLDSGDLRDLP